MTAQSQIFCTHCGHRNAYGTRYCISCGKSLRDRAAQDFGPTSVYISDFSYTPLENRNVVSVEVTNSGYTMVRNLEGKLYIQLEKQTLETLNFQIDTIFPNSSDRIAVDTVPVTGQIRVRVVVFDSNRRYDDQYFNLRLVKEIPTSGSCAIATAAYGTPLVGELESLRALRDSMLHSRIGELLVISYYILSCPVAMYISNKERARLIIRLALNPVLRVTEWLSASHVISRSVDVDLLLRTKRA